VLERIEQASEHGEARVNAADVDAVDQRPGDQPGRRRLVVHEVAHRIEVERRCRPGGWQQDPAPLVDGFSR
jgi:hypothetical protein